MPKGGLREPLTAIEQVAFPSGDIDAHALAISVATMHYQYEQGENNAITTNFALPNDIAPVAAAKMGRTLALMSSDDEGVLSRWSRLKRDAKTEQSTARPAASQREADAATGPPPDGQEAARQEGLEDEERLLTEDDLPDIDSLSYESDFSAFLQKNVPDHLHRLAMKKLWTSDPVLANLDGLNDYDLDYTIGEVMEIAAQSAEDLIRGTKRLNVTDLRARDRELRAPGRAQASNVVAPPAFNHREDVEGNEPSRVEDAQQDDVTEIPDRKQTEPS